MSNIGKPCDRQLWYEINSPEDSEPLRPETYMKFLYGDIIEAVVLFLVKAAGHSVEGTQDESEIEGIKGHRDGIIDGTIVDVKSASAFSFKKFKTGGLKEDDPFGYIPQLQSYLHAAQTDDKVKDKNRAAFLVVDKVLGHICLDFHDRTNVDIPSYYNERKEMVKGPCPERGFKDVPEGKSGNMKLGINCSYCSFSKTCWPNARTFLYATGPVTLTKIIREPNVPELFSDEEQEGIS